MRNFIIKETDKLCLRKELVGNKAANLARLRNAGYPIPSFFVISNRVFRRYVNYQHQKYKDSNANEDLKEAEYRHILLTAAQVSGCEMPARFWKELSNSIRSLDGNSELKFAVRSSSPSEDQAAHSFAGQFTTTLNVSGIHDIWEAIKKCWISLWNTNVEKYCGHFNRGNVENTMAVIVQKMVDSKASGVLFTQYPVGGDDNTMLVEATTASPNGVVSGLIEPWRFRLDKETLEKIWIHSSNETERAESFRCKSGQNYIEKVLTDLRLQELGNIGKSVEIRFDGPQDIEWAIDREKLWLLQTRPMTVYQSNERQRRDEKGDLWTDYFFVERFVDPVTPLGWSIIGKWIEKRALREPLSFLGYDESSRQTTLTRLFHFHPFTRIEVFQNLYSVVPDFAISEDKKRAFFPVSKRQNWWVEFIRRLPTLSTRFLFKDINWIPPLHLREWERFLIHYQNQLQQNRKPLFDYNLSKLGELFLRAESLTDELLSYHRWSITFADLFFHLLEQLILRWIPEADQSICVDLVSGIPGNKTVEANLELAQLASDLAKLRGCGKERMSWGTGKQRSKGAEEQGRIGAGSYKLTDCAEFNKLFERFLDRHGHRSRNLDPFYPTWRDDPDFVLGVIRELSADLVRAAAVEKSEKYAVQTRENAESFVFSSIGKKGLENYIKKKIFKYVLEMARSFTLLRENQRYYWHLALAETRRIILDLGRRLIDRNVLSHPEQIFFLSRNEFLNCFSSNADLSHLGRISDFRYKKWEQVISSEPLEQELQEKDQREVRVLQGLGVSAGEIKAKASVVRSLTEAQQIAPNSILVTRSVDPAWTPVFSKAAGLVLEVGGILSHAAIVAREFRLPAVTSVPKATSLIADGQLIYINGLKGIVRILQNS